MTEAANDFGWTAKLLRSGDERIVRATLSNNLNVILAALDRVAAAPRLARWQLVLLDAGVAPDEAERIIGEITEPERKAA